MICLFIVFLLLVMNLQEEEMKDKASKIEYAEQRLTTLSLELKVSFGLLHHLGIIFSRDRSN